MIGDDIAAELPRMRENALSLMTDVCVIRQPDSWVGEALTEGEVALTYGGSEFLPCRIKTENGIPQTLTIGGQTVPVLRLQVSLPVDVCPVKDQVVTVVSSAADPALVGRRFDVKVSGVGSHITARRVLCEEHDGALG